MSTLTLDERCVSAARTFLESIDCFTSTRTLDELTAAMRDLVIAEVLLALAEQARRDAIKDGDAASL